MAKQKYYNFIVEQKITLLEKRDEELERPKPKATKKENPFTNYFRGKPISSMQAIGIKDLIKEKDKLSKELKVYKTLVEKYRVYRDIDGSSHYDDGAKLAQEYCDWLEAERVSINEKLPSDINTFIIFMTRKFNEFDRKEE